MSFRSTSASIYLDRLRRTPWTTLVGAAWLSLLACVFLKLILPATLARALHPLLTVAPLVPFIAKDLVYLPDALARTRVTWTRDAWLDLPTACSPPCAPQMSCRTGDCTL